MKSSSGRLDPPAEFEEYRLLRPLGHGAMGQVFLAQDTLLDRQVAVKFIATAQGRLPDAAARARFFQEARAIARLQHPNVVAIHRVGEVRGQPYLVSELIRGEPLDRLQRPVDAQRALALGLGLARGLAAAHRRGILHRDIKPANAILSEDGEVKLLDFGLAESAFAEEALPASTVGADVPTSPGPSPKDTRPMPGPRPVDTQPLPVPDVTDAVSSPGPCPTDTRPLSVMQGRDTGPRLGTEASDAPSPHADEARQDFVPGTPLYLAPELWRGEPASRASDVYALGVLLYELCAGHAPHEGIPLEQLGAAIQERPRRRSPSAHPERRQPSPPSWTDASTRTRPGATSRVTHFGKHSKR
ncbi:protein kinase domain-containing protein [Myxococcus sp. MxC21-1]|uniref:serine/threonine-protein kinase n=1 Tax=Myxococcus sp. MxC21-1 TaxID=3041439 RepID=UPI003977BD2F